LLASAARVILIHHLDLVYHIEMPMLPSVQVRNRGTICGSLANADPAADYPAAMLALEAELRLESESGGNSKD
jgi:carbon-monoxide dehydrogenase medium subunit